MSSVALAKPRPTVYVLNEGCSSAAIAKALKRPAQKNPFFKPKQFVRFNKAAGAQASQAWLKNSRLKQSDSKPLLVDRRIHPTVAIRVALDHPDRLVLKGRDILRDQPECLEVQCTFQKRYHLHEEQRHRSPYVDANGNDVVDFHRTFTFNDGHADLKHGVMSWTMPLDAELRHGGRYSFTVTATLYFDHKGERRAVTFQQDPGMCVRPRTG